MAIFRSMAALVVILTLVTACGQGRKSRAPVTAPSATKTYVPPGTEPPAAPKETLASQLFPPAGNDLALTFSIRDEDKPEAYEVQEAYIWDGGVLSVHQNGRPYAYWFVNAEGIWRPDPKGGVLLRYLPSRLQNGEVWKHRSGDTDVWFHLSHGRQPCPGQGSVLQLCWELAVLNRGERTVFHFAPGLGPSHVATQNYASPAGSFTKVLTGKSPSPVSEEARRELLALLRPPGGGRAPVLPATLAEFEAAAARMVADAQPTHLRTDLDGDGRPDFVYGPLGAWTADPVTFVMHDGTQVGSYRPAPGGTHRISPWQPKETARPFFLMQYRSPGESAGVTVVVPYRDEYMTRIEMRPTYGWERKSAGTAADRVTAGDDGTITVEWDMGDPAGHTRIRTYRFRTEPNQYGPELVATRFAPTGSALKEPHSEAELLQMAFFARWFGLDKELLRYFMTPEAAREFLLVPHISEPDYGPGRVSLGRITSQPDNPCSPQVQPGVPGADGTSGFSATWGGYEWCGNVYGTVTFGRDTQGRLQIGQIQVEGHGFHGH